MRIWSISTEVSKTTKSLIVSGEGSFAAVFLHQLLEPLQADNFFQGQMDGFGAGFDAEDADGFVGELGVEADGGELDGHGRPLYGHVAPIVYIESSAGLRRRYLDWPEEPQVEQREEQAADGEF